jgi:hypothetical protein
LQTCRILGEIGYIDISSVLQLGWPSCANGNPEKKKGRPQAAFLPGMAAYLMTAFNSPFL